MTPFELAEPNTLSEALQMLSDAGPEARAASGCTALMLMMKALVLKPSRLISLRALAPGMSAIEARDGELRLGALATLSALERSAVVNRELPVIARALRTLANVRVRNVATLGGHLAHADPHMDLPPLLIALGATVSIASGNGMRTIPVESLIAGYLETTLGCGELITEVRVPLNPGRRAQYVKVTARSADDWPTLGVAVALDLDNHQVRDARVVISAAVDRPTRLQGAESLLRDCALDALPLARVADAAALEANPVADQHGSAAYKRQLVRVFVGRALRVTMESTPAGART